MHYISLHHGSFTTLARTGYANIEYCEQLSKKEMYGLLNNKIYGYVLGNNSPVSFYIQASCHCPIL